MIDLFNLERLEREAMNPKLRNQYKLAVIRSNVFKREMLEENGEPKPPDKIPPASWKLWNDLRRRAEKGA